MLDRLAPREAPPEGLALRVLIAGDAAVGKTSLVENICSGGSRRGDAPRSSAAKPAEWTCGCSLSIVRETVEIDLRPAEVEVELWEVGGTQNYAAARPVFYEGFDAVVLVYDVSNKKSYHNLVVWLFELCTCACPPSLRYWDAGGGSGGVPAAAADGEGDLEGGGVPPGGGDGAALQRAILSGRCPLLFVAHKCDLQQRRAGEEAGGSAPPRPVPPDSISLLDRLLGGGDTAAGVARRSAADDRLLERLCDLVHRGPHTEAASKEDKQSFDFALWRDFIRKAAEARPRR